MASTTLPLELFYTILRSRDNMTLLLTLFPFCFPTALSFSSFEFGSMYHSSAIVLWSQTIYLNELYFSGVVYLDMQLISQRLSHSVILGDLYQTVVILTAQTPVSSLT